jgi:hypothetical protein
MPRRIKHYHKKLLRQANDGTTTPQVVAEETGAVIQGGHWTSGFTANPNWISAGVPPSQYSDGHSGAAAAPFQSLHGASIFVKV